MTRDQQATHLMVWAGITAALARRLTELGVYDQAELADLRSHDYALQLRAVRGR